MDPVAGVDVEPLRWAEHRFAPGSWAVVRVRRGIFAPHVGLHLGEADRYLSKTKHPSQQEGCGVFGRLVEVEAEGHAHDPRRASFDSLPFVESRGAGAF